MECNLYPASFCNRGKLFASGVGWKDGRVTVFSITSHAGGTTTVRLNGKSKSLKLKKGETYHSDTIR